MTQEKIPSLDRAQYMDALSRFDAATCEALAVGEARRGFDVDLIEEYGSRVHSRMCAHAVAMVCAAPHSRWTAASFQLWDFCAVAGHARAILEASLLFHYLTVPGLSDDELHVRVNLLHLNDCSRRLEMFRKMGDQEQVDGFAPQRRELVERLERSPYFRSLPVEVRNRCLSGKKHMLWDREHAIEQVGFKKGQFDALFDHWSQHTHVLPLSFYRIGERGRGTGLENEIDRSYIGSALLVCADILNSASDWIASKAPILATVRNGTESRFENGPIENAHPIVDADGALLRLATAPLATAIRTAFRGTGQN